jgi:hypothetical protein
MGGRRLATALLVALAAAAVLRVALRPVVNPGRIEGDLAQHVWWTQRFEDPDLFPGDPLAEFMSGPAFAPWGWQGVYRAFAPLVGAERLSRILPFLLGGGTLLLAFLAGRAAARGSFAGGVAGAVCAALVKGVLDATAWGLPRSFAPPLLYLGCWTLLAGRPAAFGASLLLASLFYPPMVVNLGCLGALVLGVDLWRTRRLPRGWPGLLVLGLAAAGVLLSVYATPMPPGVGPKVTADVARGMPEFLEGGRSAYFRDDPLEHWLSSNRAGLGQVPSELAVAVAVLAIGELLLRRTRPPPLAVHGLLATSLAAFLLAHATLFLLHLPNRYAATSLPVFATLWVAASVGRAETLLRPRLARAGPRARRAAVVVAVVLVAGFVAASVRQVVSYASRKRGLDREAVLAFLSTLPKDALVAAHPSDADFVPLRARRSVLANHETALPYWLGHYARVKERLRASFEIVYAADLDRALEVARRHGVDAVLVNALRYSEEGLRYPPPLGAEVLSLASEASGRGFAMLSPPEDRVLFRAGPYTVVRTDG